MASKVMVKIPATSFGQGQMNKTKSNSVAGVESSLPVPRGLQECGTRGHETPPQQQQHLEGSRVLQLEQNIRFLQEQHQLMLTGLHKEIESLRNKNRDLHFQLVFAKGSLPSSPSSPEDESKTKVYSSPKPVNVIPLQVEILEKEIGELKTSLNESEHENARLTEALEEYKRKLDELERSPTDETASAPAGPLSEKREQELVEAAGELQVVVRRLRQENASLRREKAALAGSLVASRAASQGMFCPLGGFSNGYHQLSARGEHMSPGYQGAPRGHQQQGRNGRYRGSNGAGGYNRGPSQSTSPSIQGQTYWPRVRPERPPPADEEGVLLPSLAQQPGSAGGGHQNHRRSANNNHPRRIRGRGGEPS